MSSRPLRSSALKIAAIALLAGALGGCTSELRDAMARGDRFASVGDWDHAAMAYAQAVAIDPDDETARRALEYARRGQSKMRLDQGAALLRAGQPREALVPFSEAVRLDPRNFLAQQGLAEAERQVLADASASLGRGEGKRAFELARAVLAVDPSSAEGAAVEAKARDAVSQAAFARGQALEAAKAPSLALVDYGEALEYRPDHAQALARWGEIRKALREQVTYVVAMKNFDGDDAADDLGSDVDATALGAGLDPLLPLRVVDRVPKPGAYRIQGMRLGGAFSHFDFKRESSRSARTCDYVCGRERVANPAYATAEADMKTSQSLLGAAEARLATAKAAIAPAERSRDDAKVRVEARRGDRDRARADLDRCRAASSAPGSSCSAEEQKRTQAEADLRTAEAELTRLEQSVTSAKSELLAAETDVATKRSDASRKRSVFDSTPAQTEVDKHCSHTYPVETVTVRSEVECSLHGEGLYDTDPVLSASVTGRAMKADDTFAPQANVCAEVARGDPLEVPGEAEMKRLAVRAAVEAAQKELLGAYARYSATYLTRARAAAADRRDDEAADAFVRYLCTLTSDAAKAETQEAVAAIARLRQVDDKAVRLAIFGAAR